MRQKIFSDDLREGSSRKPGAGLLSTFPVSEMALPPSAYCLSWQNHYLWTMHLIHRKEHLFSIECILFTSSLGDQDEASGSWLQTNTALAAAAIWEVNQRMKDSVSLSLCPLLLPLLL